jgi:hypothetical protein
MIARPNGARLPNATIAAGSRIPVTTASAGRALALSASKDPSSDSMS